MEARILELLQFPQSVVNEDFAILERNLQQYPYMQSLRAIHLLGTKKFREEDYVKNLSLSAAYTTEKKNLFLLLNSENQIDTTVNLVEAKEEVPHSENIEKPKIFDKIASHDYEGVAEILPETEVEKVKIDGEINRILFPGEENFFAEPSLKIDREATLESGKIIIAEDYSEKIPAENKEIEVGNLAETKEIVTVSKVEMEEKTPISEIKTEENVADLEIKPEEKTEVLPESHDINFHETSTFLPEMKLTPKKEEFVPKKESSNKHEDEMARLIAEVEAKMKQNKAKKTQPEEPEIVSHEINFSENHDEVLEGKIEEIQPKEEILPKEEIQPKSDWKPMNFNLGNSEPKKEIQTEEIQPTEIEPKYEIQPEIQPEKIQEKEESNVPTFINTWQNWLKISPKKSENLAEEISQSNVENEIPEVTAETETAEIQEETSEESEISKDEILENFIQNNPKISRLSDENSFTVKDRGDDISHLMTETFANLYLEQKLYSKAIKAYEILKNKFPENAEKYNQTIEKIKEMRSIFKP